MSCEHWTQGSGFAKASLYAACPWCEIARLRAKVQQLQCALNFWLPTIPEEAPLGENPCMSRIERDANLLFEFKGEDVDEQCATELGWVQLQVPQPGERT